MQSWNSSTLATWCEELTHLKRPWCWERLKAGGGDNEWSLKGSLTPWTWVWVSSRSWCWTGKPGVLQSMGSQWVRHNRATELSRTETCRCEDGIHFYPFVCIFLRRWNSSVLVGLVDLSLASTVFGQNRPMDGTLLQPGTTHQHFSQLQPSESATHISWIRGSANNIFWI